MKADATISGAGVSLALAKGTCPIWAMPKDYQWTLDTSTRPSRDLRLCSFHCGSLARARGARPPRSTPGEAVTDLLVEMLRGPVVGKVPSTDCGLCRQVLNEEAVRLRELGKKFRGPNLFPIDNQAGHAVCGPFKKAKRICAAEIQRAHRSDIGAKPRGPAPGTGSPFANGSRREILKGAGG